MPFADLCRVLTATGNFTTGGALVESTQTAVEEALRPVSAVRRLGAQIILNGNPVEMAANITSSRGGTVVGCAGTVGVPYDNGNSGGDWYDETETAIVSDNTVSMLNMGVHRWTLATTISSQLAIQSSAPEVIAGSIARTAGSGLDAAALSGTSGSPLGILNQAGVTSITFGGAATNAKLTDFIQAIENANVEPRLDHASRHQSSISGHPEMDWQGVALYDVDNDTICGKKAITSTHASSTTGLVCGAWSHYRIALWGANAPIQITVNPYSHAPAGKIE